MLIGIDHYKRDTTLPLTQKSLLTSDIFDLWRLPKHRRRIGWRQNNVEKRADVTWRRSFRSPTLSNVGASNSRRQFSHQKEGKTWAI